MELLLSSGHPTLHQGLFEQSWPTAGASQRPWAQAGSPPSQGSPLISSSQNCREGMSRQAHRRFALRSTKSGLWALACLCTYDLDLQRETQHTLTCTHILPCEARSCTQLLSGFCCCRLWEPHLRKDKGTPAFILYLPPGIPCILDSLLSFSPPSGPSCPPWSHLLLPSSPSLVSLGM